MIGARARGRWLTVGVAPATTAVPHPCRAWTLFEAAPDGQVLDTCRGTASRRGGDRCRVQLTVSHALGDAATDRRFAEFQCAHQVHPAARLKNFLIQPGVLGGDVGRSMSQIELDRAAAACVEVDEHRSSGVFVDEWLDAGLDRRDVSSSGFQQLGDLDLECGKPLTVGRKPSKGVARKQAHPELV